MAITSALFTGCGEKPTGPAAGDSGSQLTASDLARLVDFHAWKGPIPQNEQSVKAVRLLIAKEDGSTVATVFDTGNNLRPEPAASILLGFRQTGEAFKGYIFIGDAKGGSTGWRLDFTNAFADSNPAWGGGRLLWAGNRARLGMSTRDNNFENFLVLELVK